MSKGFFGESLVRRPQLLAALLRANRPQPQVEEGLDVAAVGAALGRDAAALCAWLHAGVRRCPPLPMCVASGASEDAAPPGLWDYAEESRRLGLVQAGHVRQLAAVAGVALHAQEVAQVVRRSECLALRRELGEELYAYALYRGQFQLGGVRRLFASLHSLLPLAQRCALHGVMALWVVARSWPEPYVARFAALAPPLPQGEALPDFGPAEGFALWLALKKLLLREVLPAWAPCFD